MKVKDTVVGGVKNMRLCELRDKEVINICSGRRLGCIVDVEINVCNGEVEAVVIPGPGKICGFLGTDCEYVIPFACIRSCSEPFLSFYHWRRNMARWAFLIISTAPLLFTHR